jgi:hypothetical protein
MGVSSSRSASNQAGEKVRACVAALPPATRSAALVRRLVKTRVAEVRKPTGKA